MSFFEFEDGFLDAGAGGFGNSPDTSTSIEAKIFGVAGMFDASVSSCSPRDNGFSDFTGVSDDDCFDFCCGLSERPQ